LLKDYFFKQKKYKILRQAEMFKGIYQLNPLVSISRNNFLLDLFENYGILRALKNMEIDD